MKLLAHKDWTASPSCAVKGMPKLASATQVRYVCPQSIVLLTAILPLRTSVPCDAPERLSLLRTQGAGPSLSFSWC